MIPRIIVYEDGVIKLTAEAFTIPEVNKIITKYGDEDCIPYVTFVSHLSYPDSPYRNLPQEDRREAAIYDIKETLGDFNEDEELMDDAINRLVGIWQSAATLAADEMEEELHRWRIYLRDTPMGGDMKDRITIVDKFEKVAISAANLRKIADNELGTKMKGDNEIGEY